MTSKTIYRRPVPRLALNRTELALSIGVSVSSVDAMVAEGTLPPPRIWHTRKLWLVTEVEAYLNNLPADGGETDDNPFDEPVVPLTAEIKKGAGGYPIPSDPRHPLAAHYAALGFDPKTMGKEDYSRLYRLAHERWLAEIPALPFNKREKQALLQFIHQPVGPLIKHDAIKHYGPDTSKRLQARGFIEVFMYENDPSRQKGYVFTEADYAPQRL
ncbi:MAG: hypothetical protein KGO02_25965 [Alphaproteobacteria bacterium]|nr:hypothetical protein [Alphaproteobacteria bacterium]